MSLSVCLSLSASAPYVCVCVYVCAHEHVSIGALGSQKHWVSWGWSYGWL